MWQLMNRHRRSCRPVVCEVLSVDFVVAGESIHVDQIRSDLYHVFKPGPHTFEDVANIVEGRSGLDSNVKMRSPEFVNARPRDRVICPARARARHDQKISSSLYMRILPPRHRLAFDYFCFDFPHAESSTRLQPNTNIVQFRIKIQRVSPALASDS